MFLQSFALVMKWFCSCKLNFSKIDFFFTNCDEMLNFMNTKNLDTCVYRYIQGVMTVKNFVKPFDG